jgi:elongation factor 3
MVCVCRFPTPGLLDGITSKEKPICKLTNVSFAYPGATKPQLTDVNVAARLSSRVAVIGVNGAGKSVSNKVIVLLATVSPCSCVHRNCNTSDLRTL